MNDEVPVHSEDDDGNEDDGEHDQDDDEEVQVHPGSLAGQHVLHVTAVLDRLSYH